jgi:hypothetical protein
MLIKDLRFAPVGDQRGVAVGQIAVRVRRAEASTACVAHGEGQPREPRAGALGGRACGRRACAARLPPGQGLLSVCLKRLSNFCKGHQIIIIIISHMTSTVGYRPPSGFPRRVLPGSSDFPRPLPGRSACRGSSGLGSPSHSDQNFTISFELSRRYQLYL